MRYPTLEKQDTTRQMIDVFGGYNHNLRINEGEFYDMKNLTSTHYPILSPRPQRGVEVNTYGEKLGLIAKDSLGYIEGGKFYLNKYEIADLEINPSAVAEKTSIVSMGAYVIIIARDEDGDIVDKKWVNTNPTVDIEGNSSWEFGNIDVEITSKDQTNVRYDPCDAEGKDLVIVDSKDTKTNGAVYIDKTGGKTTFMQYSESSEMWSPMPTTYVRIAWPGVGTSFNQYDGVLIDGISVAKKEGEHPEIEDLNGKVSIIQAKTDGWIVVTGILPETTFSTSIVTIKREMPLMDFLVESGNRLWGCRYGKALNGEIVNKIYASKLGDFKNWFCYMEISTDSYDVSLGTDGQFTGAITYLDHPIFFKENCMHKVYGKFPSNFQVQTTPCRGVQKGCHNSLAIVNETLFYKSRSAVCAYDGSLPAEVSSDLGDVQYSNAVACSHGNKYYISMTDDGEKYHLFVYDASKGLWHKEDNLQVKSFCSCRGELYYIEHGSNQIKTMLGSGTKDTTPVEWMAETGIIGTDSPDKKYISRLNIRMALEKGAKVNIFIQYDSVGWFEHIVSLRGNSLRSFSIPIRPQRCDHLRLRIEGVGEAKVYSITKTIEEGSDI